MAKDKVQTDVGKAEKNNRMSLRTLANKVFALSPLILIGLVCLRARLYSDSYEQPLESTEQREAISAYREAVKDSFGPQVTYKDPQTLRSIAKVWVDGAAEGKLKPLPPCASDDTLRGPIKNQIYTANQSVADNLRVLASDERAEGRYESAAEDLILDLKVSDVLKNSDPISVFILSDKEDFALKALDRMLDQLPGPERQHLLTELERFRSAQVPLSGLYRTVKYVSEEDSERARVNETASYDPMEAAEIGMTEDGTSYRAALLQIKSGAKRVQSTPYLEQTGLAYKSQQRLLDLLDKVVVKLREIPPQGVCTAKASRPA